MVWLGVTYTITCFVNRSWNTRTLVTLGGLFGSMVILMLVKSTCKRSIGAVDTIRCRGALGRLPSCCKQHVQYFMDCYTWLVIPGHQNHSSNSNRVYSCPWWPISQWHPFKVTTQCALGTMKSRRSSVLPLGVECRYKAPWRIAKFCLLCKIRLPSSLETCSTRSTFKSVFFCAFSQSNTVLNIRSSLWALAQSVTCISTNGCPMAMHTSCSKCWSPSTTARLQTLAQCAIPKATPSRMDFMVSGFKYICCGVVMTLLVLLTQSHTMQGHLPINGLLHLNKVLTLCTCINYYLFTPQMTGRAGTPWSVL